MIENSLPPLIKTVTCAVTGHRNIPDNLDFNAVVEELKNIVSLGYEYFLDGLALGFDSVCFRALELLRESGEKVKIVGVMPCADQSRNFTKEQKAEYERMKKSADVLLGDTRTYFRGCMLMRNDFLVNNSSLIFAGYSGIKRGGTYYTIKRAAGKGVDVRFFAFNERKQ